MTATENTNHELAGQLIMSCKDNNAQIKKLASRIRRVGMILQEQEQKGERLIRSTKVRREVMVDGLEVVEEKPFVAALLDISITLKDGRFVWGKGHRIGVEDFDALAENIKELQAALEEKARLDKSMQRAGLKEFIVSKETLLGVDAESSAE